MRYLLVPFEYWGYYENLMPKEKLDTLDENNSVVVGAVDDATREPYGVIAFTVSEDVFNQVVYMKLDWLFVKEGVRESGTGSSLLKYMEHACRASNIKSVRFELKKEYETEVLLYFLNKRLYGISQQYYGLYETTLGRMQDNTLIKEILSMKTEGKILPVSIPLIRDYLSDLQKMVDSNKLYEGIKSEQILDSVIDEKFDFESGMGYVCDDVLAGLVLAEEISAEKIIVRYITFHKGYGVQAAAAMLKIFNKAISEWYGKDVKILIESHNQYTDGLMVMVSSDIERINVYDAKLQ